MNLVIETHQLGKRYGSITAVENLSLQVVQGEIYAFLGLNGAGKTTTIRMLLGMIKPTAGSATVLGTRVRLGSRQPWASVGYLVEIPYNYPELTVYENLEVARRLHPGTPPRAVSDIIEQLGLSEYAARRAGTLSQGNGQRLGIAKALLHQPGLLILDEPANGLDPAGIVEIRALLLQLTRQQGATVFMSSHILAEVSLLASRIGIIHQGRLLQELDIDELERNRHRRLAIRTAKPEQARQVLAEHNLAAKILPDGALELRAPPPMLKSIRLNDSTNQAEQITSTEPNRPISSTEHPDLIATWLVQAGVPPTYLAVEEEDLEKYFLRMVGSAGVQNA